MTNKIMTINIFTITTGIMTLHNIITISTLTPITAGTTLSTWLTTTAEFFLVQ
jgi:hypothetical protein